MQVTKILTLFLSLAVSVLCPGCMDKGREDGKRGVPDAPEDASAMRHARVFTMSRRADTTVIRVRKPWQGSTADFEYRLVPSGAPASLAAPQAAPATLVVPVPLRKAVTMTTTNLRHIEAIGSLDALSGLGGGRYVCSPAIRERLRSGRIVDVGEDVGVDVEAVMALKPDLVFTYIVGGSSDGGLSKLAETGIPSVIEGSYMEETPLGRAEWIKFTAAFFGKESRADSLFTAVESAYRSLAAKARSAAHRPKVFVGAPFGGVWWVPGGRTYVARLLEDAGAEYLWAGDTTRGSLSLDMESVLGRAAGADVWLNAGDWRDLGAARDQDRRNSLFKAFRDGNVYVNDAFLCEGGGRDFYETGASRPDWILADLVSILHPELLPGHERRWYRKLGEPE